MGKRNRLLLGIIIGTALIVAASAIFAMVSASRARGRTDVRVRIELTYEADRTLDHLVHDTIEGAPVPIGEERTGTIHVSEPEPSGRVAAWDVAIGPTEKRYAPTDQTPLAIDPYVLAVYRDSLPDSSVDESATIARFIAALRDTVSPNHTPLVIAGDEPIDFAAFVLYLSGELLDEEARAAIHAALWPEDVSAREASEELIDELVIRLDPVIDTIGRWRDAGVLATNWTDWDRIAVVAAIRGGSVSAAFLPRSEVKSLDREQRIQLAQRMMPVAQGHRQFRMIGRTLVVKPGPGIRASAYRAVNDLLRTEPVLRSIETETAWSPVAALDTPISASHDRIMRWYERAAEYLEIEATIALHPLFTRLHILLR